MSKTLENKNNVINKLVIYKDEPAIQLTSINEIDENSLEDCINTIVSSNSDVIFNTIQYSKKAKTLHFYTYNAINTKEWYKKRENNEHHELATISDILGEIKKVLISSDKPENSCMSVNDNPSLISIDIVSELLREKTQEERKTKKNFEAKTREILEEIDGFSDCASSEIESIDYFNKVLKIKTYRGIYSGFSSAFIETNLLKKDADFKVLERSSDKSADVMKYIGTIVGETYDELLKYEGLNSEKSSDIKSANSNFYVDINKAGVTVHNLNGVFLIKANNNFKQDYGYYCNSLEIINTLNNCEQDLFKNILVRISDCPKWMQESLYERRIQQLEEKNSRKLIKQEETLSQEISINKQKKIGFRKFFPFFNKTESDK